MQLTIVHMIPTLEGGGAERQLALLVTTQLERGYEVHVCIRRTGAHEAPLRSGGARIHLLGDHRGLSPILALRARRVLEQCRPRVVQTWLPQMDIVGGLACMYTGVPWILTERASRPAYAARRLLTRVRASVGRRADAIVANSIEGARYWREVGSERERISIVRNAIDIRAVQEAAQRSRYSSSSDERRTVLVVGRLDQQKAVDVVLRAIPRIESQSSFRFLVIGNGPQLSGLTALAEELRVRQHVEFCAHQGDWWKLLGQASVLVSMSRYEGQPNVVLEAVAAGCPVILSDIPEHREFLDDNTALFTPAEDSEALARAIAIVLDDPSSADARAHGAIRAIEGLTRHLAADAYEDVYRRALRRAG